jgi:hypothetical protein
MVYTTEAVFDGEVLRPAAPLAIEPNTRVHVVIETIDEVNSPRSSFLETARALGIEGPADWSENIDSYLYGEEAERGS